MNRTIRTIVTTFFTLALCVACEKQNRLNSEADIDFFSFNPESVMEEHAQFNGNDIFVTVKKDVALTSLTPVIRVSRGATISPEIKEKMDFSHSVTFKVVSENKEVERVYTVRVSHPAQNRTFSFERWKKNENYEEPTERDADENEIPYWASSNLGYALFNQKIGADLFPVSKIEGTTGKGVKMTTMKGIHVVGINVPLVPGSLFSGKIDVKNIADPKNALKSTLFGQFIDAEPIEITGYYHYRAGKQLTDEKGNPLEGKDRGCLAAVLYETDASFLSIDGENTYTDPHIVSLKKEIVTDTEGENYIKFSLKPERKTNHIDFNTKRYKLALIFSSSVDGDKFKGAIGSTLKIDEVNVTTK